MSTAIALPTTTPSPLEDAIAAFIALRPRLHGIAWRILGSHADADDVVQDAWVRWQTCDRTAVRNPTAFLVTVTTRLAINAAQSARARREAPVGDWLTEPVDTAADPTTGPEVDEALALGVGRLFDHLSPAERAAFVLRHGFDYPYPVIAGTLGLTEGNARQLVSRAGKRLAGPRRRAADALGQRRLVAAVRTAADHGDVATLEQVLAA